MSADRYDNLFDSAKSFQQYLQIAESEFNILFKMF